MKIKQYWIEKLYLGMCCISVYFKGIDLPFQSIYSLQVFALLKHLSQIFRSELTQPCSLAWRKLVQYPIVFGSSICCHGWHALSFHNTNPSQLGHIIPHPPRMGIQSNPCIFAFSLARHWSSAELPFNVFIFREIVALGFFLSSAKIFVAYWCLDTYWFMFSAHIPILYLRHENKKRNRRYFQELYFQDLIDSFSCKTYFIWDTVQI